MAFPTYRMSSLQPVKCLANITGIVYTIQYAKGETAFCDGYRAVSPEPDAAHRHHFLLPDSWPRINRTYDAQVSIISLCVGRLPNG